FVVDAANPTQVSSSCIQLLSILSAEQLASVPVLVLFNKIDLPCYMSLVEMKSLFRMQDIISCATQPITFITTQLPDNVPQWVLGRCNPEKRIFPSTPGSCCFQRHATVAQKDVWIQSLAVSRVLSCPAPS
ncbi:PREDICTED: ADP-ribosylation factor-like protein 16, partial [Phaethon lepturus]|uniref:ADP-ribosylation factor-like protein 16 n=1 Tax=Phaethon lepturus TaxID=97097 RepID=UPI0005306352